MQPVESNNEWEKVKEAFYQEDIAGALFVLKKMARNGDREVYVEIGNIYEMGGVGVEQSYEEAKKWYKLAEDELGDPLAYWALGRIYYGGLGCEQDYEKAFYYFSLIEEESRPGVLYALGTMYENGRGVVKNKKTAFSYYKRSANLGHLLGMRQLGLLKIKNRCYFSGLKIYLKSIIMIFKAVMKNTEDERVKVC